MHLNKKAASGKILLPRFAPSYSLFITNGPPPLEVLKNAALIKNAGNILKWPFSLFPLRSYEKGSPGYLHGE